jgi:hypothetical protein
VNDKLTLLRRQLAREADESEKELLKGTRWLLVTSRKILDDEENQREADIAALDKTLKANEPLYIAYYLKEELSSLWSKQSKIEARAFLIAASQRQTDQGCLYWKRWQSGLQE